MMTKPSKRVRKAILPAAGLGTRFLPATKAQPKEMLPVVDKPLIQYVVEECVASNIENIIIVTGRGKNAIEDHFDFSPELERFLEDHGKIDQADLVRSISNMVHFSYTRQKEPLGLGHAVLAARELVGDEPFAVLLGDVIIRGPQPATRPDYGRLRRNRHRDHRYGNRSAGERSSLWRHQRRACREPKMGTPPAARPRSGREAES